MTPQGVSLFLFIAFFAAILVPGVDRRWAMVVGGGVLFAVGWSMNFYTPAMVMEALHFETLALIFGMSMISDTIGRSGYFDHVAVKAVGLAMGDGWVALVLFTLLTYAISLFVNNLAAMVVIIPITLALCRQAKIDPVPVLMAEIIASNLGGASSMVGDFPNMIIAAKAKLQFIDFIGGMMAPCLLLLATTLLFFMWRREALFPARMGQGEGVSLDLPLGKVTDPALLRLGTTVLVVTLAGFLLGGFLGVRPGVVAFMAGILLLVVGGLPRHRLFTAMSGGDLLFFAGLFAMVGGVQAAGVLSRISQLIEYWGGGSPGWEVVLLMWGAGVATLFLNAGPTTALFVPIASEMSSAVPGHTVWWALSLGVLAGSSGSLTGATAGSVAASFLDNHVRAFPDVLEHMRGGGLNFFGYLRWGMPIMMMFLLLSTFYILMILP